MLLFLPFKMLDSPTNFTEELYVLGFLFSNNDWGNEMEVKSCDDFMFRGLINVVFDVLIIL